MICEELTTKIKEEVTIEYDIVQEELNDSDENVEFVDYYNDEMDAVDCLETQQEDNTAEKTQKKRMQCILKGSRKQNKKQTSRLIDMVKECPMLYDPTHEDYKRNVIHKNKTWEHFAAELGADSGDVLKTRWKNLRDSYSKHLRYGLNSTKNSTNKHLSCYKTWPWVHKMSFLLPFLDTTPVKEKPKPKIKEVERKTFSKNFFNDKNYDQTDLIFLGYSKTIKKMSKRIQAITKFKIAEIMMRAEKENALEKRSTVSLKNKNQSNFKTCVLQAKRESDELIDFQETPVSVNIVDANTALDPLLLIPDVEIKRSDSVDF